MVLKTRFSEDDYAERRGSPRVIDAVGLTVRMLGESRDAAAVPAVGAPARFAGFEQLRTTHPDAVEYILSLESQLGLISRRDDDAKQPESPTHKVSLSLSGIAFSHERMLQPGDRIEIEIVLFPVRSLVQAEATVVSVGGAVEAGRHVGSGKYAARAIFSKLKDDDRVTLDQHIQSILRQL